MQSFLDLGIMCSNNQIPQQKNVCIDNFVKGRIKPQFRGSCIIHIFLFYICDRCIYTYPYILIFISPLDVPIGRIQMEHYSKTLHVYLNLYYVHIIHLWTNALLHWMSNLGFFEWHKRCMVSQVYDITYIAALVNNYICYLVFLAVCCCCLSSVTTNTL